MSSRLPGPERPIGRARGAPRSGRAAGPAVLFVPLILFVVSVVWLATARPKRGEAPARAPEVRIESVEGWTGSSPEDGALRVVARLTRLHADPRRQAFESQALARRLGLSAGEPFRLELRALSTGGSDAEPPIPLTGLEVRDREGLALAPLPAHVPLPDDGVADPLAVLLGLPPALEPGSTVGLVVWGRAPGAGARLEGCGEGAVELEAGALSWRAVDEALARLERSPAPAAEGATELDGR